MHALPVATRLVQSLGVLQTQAEAYHAVALSQSLTAWLSYYRLLERVHGGANPSTAALLRQQCAPLATALLDQVTDTFCTFFALPWLRAERTHARLLQVFLSLCSDTGWHGDTAGVYASMRAMHAHLMALGTASDTWVTPETVGARYRVPCADLSAFVSHLERYLISMLEFFAQNYTHSILSKTWRPDHP